MRRKQEQFFKTEAELCAAFAEVAESKAWKVYPETCGWDQLLVNGAGEQIGVQAKLRPSLRALFQAIDSDHEHIPGPDFRAVMVGCRPNRDFHTVANHLGIICIFPNWDRKPIFPNLPSAFRKHPKRRHPLPEFVPDVPAGVPGPIQLTPWKIQAIRLCAVLRLRGHVTKADFKRYGVDRRRWFLGAPSWLRVDEEGRYVAAGKRLPDQDHPGVSAQIAEQVKAELERVA